MLKIALIGIFGGLFLLWGPLGGMFWQGVACIAAGGLSLLLAIRALIRREPEDEIEVETPVGEDEDDVTDEELALLRKAAEHEPTPDPAADDRRYRGLEIAVRIVLAVGTVALVVMKVFLWSPEAIERGKREEDHASSRCSW